MKMLLNSDCLRSKKSFTLMELMVITVLISVLITLAYPSYKKTLQCTKEREIINNLFTIYGAARVYKIKNGAYPTQDLSDLAAINQTLGLNLVSSDATSYKYYLINNT